MKKQSFLILIFCWLTMVNVCAAPVSESPEAEQEPPSMSEEISAVSYCVMDAISGRVLTERDPHTQYPIASITKIMTAICAIENGNLGDTVTVSQHADDTQGSSCWLSAGEKQTLDDLLYGLMLASGNDAAVAIAEHISGSETEFVSLMNQTAQRIGATNTHFMNPHGLDEDGHYSSSYDMALITRYALTLPDFKRIVATKTKTIPWEGAQWDRTLVNHNKFLDRYEGAIGVKTGYTDKAGRTLVTAVEKNGLTLIVVTLNAPDDWRDHEIMYNSVFESYQIKTFKKAGDWAGSILVKNGKQPSCDLRYSEDMTAYLLKTAKEADFSVTLKIPENLEAPVLKGEHIGEAFVYYQGEEVAKSEVIAANGIEHISFFQVLCQTVLRVWKKTLRLFQ